MLQALDEEDFEDDQSDISTSDSGADFNYILSMQLWCLTKEKKDELCKQRDAKSEELFLLRKKTPHSLWKNDLEEFSKELQVHTSSPDTHSAGRKWANNKWSA